MPRLKPALLTTLLLCSPAAAQPVITYELSWRAIPSHSTSVLLLGESAEIVLTARYAPQAGSIISYPAPPPGTSPVAGLGSIFFDVVGCGGSNAGTWTLSGSGFGGTTGTNWGQRTGWASGPVGTPQLNGDVTSCSAGQFPIPGQTASALNPILEIWRGKWTPSNYQPGRIHRFTISPVESRLLVQLAANQYASVVVPSQATSINIFIDPGNPGPCLPQISQQPQNAVIAIGERATFSVAASIGTGCSPLSYSWRKGCTTLSNGGNISGANSPTLVIDPVTSADNGQYEAVVSFLPSLPATLTVFCYPNCDNSAVTPILNINDFTCFVGQYAVGTSYANCDHSTVAPILNIADFICFVNKYAAGCQ